MDLTYCDVLYKDLSRGLEGLLLNSYLHLVYLVTPYELVPQCKPDWMIFFRQVRCQTPQPPRAQRALLTSCSPVDSSPCCLLQSRRCLQPSAFLRASWREKLQDRR